MATSNARAREKDDEDRPNENSSTSTAEPVERVVVYSVERNSRDKHGGYISEQEQLMRHAAGNLRIGAVVVDMGTSFVGGATFADEAELTRFLDGLDGSISRLKSLSSSAVAAESTIAKGEQIS